MKKIILIAVCLSLFISLSSAYAQDVTDQEWETYYKYQEKIFNWGQEVSEEEQGKVRQEVVDEYGITDAELSDIGRRILFTEPTQQDLGIFNDLSDTFDTFPDGATVDEQKQMYIDIGDKYGVPPFRVAETYMRVFNYKYFVQDHD